jgi:ubiquinone/menaquinone biosynthesis C-methylase UbiE
MTATPLDQQAALDFVLVLRRRWADMLYPALAEQYETSAPSEPVRDPVAIAPAVHQLPAWNWFAWLERGSQKMLWRAVKDVIATSPDPVPVAGIVPPALDANLELPDWYTAWDIHLQPGGVWSSPAAARVYELGAKLVMMGDNDDYAFHHLFTRTAVPHRAYRHIVDLGCGFGKSTWPLKQAFPEADVTGVDLSAACLALAAERVAERGLDIGFVQADATATGLEAGSADLVTSTMLIHELPVHALEALFREASRLLAPGGLLRFLDFQPTGDPLRDLAIIEHGARNNEPFLPPMLAADLPSMAAAAGLAGARWTPFDERGAGRLDTARWPDRQEWHFPWAVLEAEKPS